MQEIKNNQLLKVLVVDDSDIVAVRVRNMLATLHGVMVIGTAGSGEEALVIANIITPDVVLLDLSLPGMSGLDTMKELKKKYNDVVIVMLTNNSEPHSKKACMEAGAAYFFDKSTEIQNIPATINRIGATKTFING